MTNNDVFKSIIQITGLSRDIDLMLEIFALGGITASQGKLRGWRTPVDNPRHSRMSDVVLEGFFIGLFEYRDLKADQGVMLFNFPSNTLEAISG